MSYLQNHMSWIRWVVGVVALMLMMQAALTIRAQDDATEAGISLPAPTGPYQVGKTSRHWVDETRAEISSEDPDLRRELMVRIWYPAEVDNQSTLAPYFEDFAAPNGEEALAKWYAAAAVGFTGDNPNAQAILQAQTNSFLDVPVSSAQLRFPVLIFSPALLDIPEEYTIQIEELASHGYVVAGIQHPYCSGVTVFPDGRIVPGAGYSTLIERTCVDDILFVLDQLEVLDAGEPEGTFSGRLDLERVGVFGHSLGGWLAAQAGSLDDRIRAVINEDGPQRAVGYDPDMLEQPFMFFTTPLHPLTYPSGGLNYRVTVDGFEHRSFTDNPIYPLTIPETGAISDNRTIDIVRVYVLAFFDKHLKGEDSGLLDGPSEDYSEVEIRSTNTE